MNRKSCAENHFGMWLVEPGWLNQAVDAVKSGMWEPDQDAAIDLDLDDDQEDDPLYTVDESGIATIFISGHMIKHQSSFGGTSTLLTRKAVVQADNDPNVNGIMLLIDSPGGSVASVFDLAQSIADTSKPIMAYAQDMMASAALLVGVQADHVSANVSALVGSIGVYSQVIDRSEQYEAAGVKVYTVSTGKFKGAFADGQEITEDELEYLQERVDSTNELFIDAVVQGRQMSESQVQQLANGKTWVGTNAMQRGLVDEIETLDTAYERLEAAISGTTFTPPKEDSFMFGKSEQEEAAEKVNPIERLDELTDIFAELGDDTADAFANRAFSTDMTPDQAKAMVAQVKKVNAKSIERAEAAEGKLADAEERIEDLETENEGLKERLEDGNKAVDEGGESQADTDLVKRAEKMAEEKDIKFSEAMNELVKENPEEYEKQRSSR